MRPNYDERSERSSTSTLAGSLRVQVVLFQSKKLAVPVDVTTSFEDLEAESIRRAARLRIQVPPGEYEFRLDSSDGPSAYPADLLHDVLDLGSSPTVWLQLIGTSVRISQNIEKSH
jgi:hypothetical protein